MRQGIVMSLSTLSRPVDSGIKKSPVSVKLFGRGKRDGDHASQRTAAESLSLILPRATVMTSYEFPSQQFPSEHPEQCHIEALATWTSMPHRGNATWRQWPHGGNGHMELHATWSTPVYRNDI